MNRSRLRWLPFVSCLIVAGCGDDDSQGSTQVPTSDFIAGAIQLSLCDSGSASPGSWYAVLNEVAAQYEDSIANGFDGPFSAYFQCVAGAQSCAEVDACSSCASSSIRCIGDVMDFCAYGRPAQIDCGAQGMTCTAAGGDARCTAGVCSVGGYSCDDDVVVHCDDETESRYDCRLSPYENGTCYAWNDGFEDTASCVSSPVTPCVQGSFTEYCEGAVAVRCAADEAVVIREDCSKNAIRTACYVDDLMGDAVCGLPGTPVSVCPGASEDYCDGNILRRCQVPYALEVDCAALGATCGENGSGSPACVRD